MNMKMGMEGKTAVVTGGSRGIGNAVMLELLCAGASVWYLSRSQAENHEEVLKVAEAHGAVAVHIPTDMSDESSITAAFDTILKERKSIDILINNAGITRDGLIMRMKTEDFNDVLKVNLTGTFIASRCVTRAMAKARSGVIINISSVVGVSGNAGQTNYAASKAGVIGFSKSLAKELSSRSVRVNVIAPGFIATDMTKGLPESVTDELKKQIPLGRIGDAQEIAKAALFLASDDASYITGVVLAVDGGMTM